MLVTDVQVAALRALLSDDLDRYNELAPAAFADGHGCDALFTGAFIEAVRDRLGVSATHGDVVRLVAAIRARRPKRADEIDVRAAERMIRAALGEVSAIDGMTEEDKADIQSTLLVELIADEQFDLATLDELLARARVHAEQIPERQVTDPE
jgi:hypothetical protein